MLVAAWPIIDSSRTRPATGTLVMARLLSPRRRARDRPAVVNLSVAGSALDDPRLPAGLAGGRRRRRAFGRDRVAAYGLLEDFDGRARRRVPRRRARGLRRQGIITVLALLAWVDPDRPLVRRAVFLFLERAVLSRLHALSAGVLAIGTADEPGRWLALTGRDEFAYLGAAINGMLDSLEPSPAPTW